MNNSKLTEFIWALISAIILAGAVIFSLYKLSGTAQTIAIVVIILAALGAIQLLRKRFGRNL